MQVPALAQQVAHMVSFAAARYAPCDFASADMRLADADGCRARRQPTRSANGAYQWITRFSPARIHARATGC
jgi:hypothetical protein